MGELYVPHKHPDWTHGSHHGSLGGQTSIETHGILANCTRYCCYFNYYLSSKAGMRNEKYIQTLIQKETP